MGDLRRLFLPFCALLFFAVSGCSDPEPEAAATDAPTSPDLPADIEDAAAPPDLGNATDAVVGTDVLVETELDRLPDALLEPDGDASSDLLGDLPEPDAADSFVAADTTADAGVLGETSDTGSTAAVCGSSADCPFDPTGNPCEHYICKHAVPGDTGVCELESLGPCCISNSDCPDDGDPCTVEICELAPGEVGQCVSVGLACR